MCRPTPPPSQPEILPIVDRNTGGGRPSVTLQRSPPSSSCLQEARWPSLASPLARTILFLSMYFPASPPLPLERIRTEQKNALNLADMRYGLGAEELEVGEIFVTKGKVVKRIRIMGRGRAGISRCDGGGGRGGGGKAGPPTQTPVVYHAL